MKDFAHTETPGAGVVGRLSEAAPWEAELIMAMRLWMDGPDGQAQVWNAFARTFGPSGARSELRQFEALLARLCAFGRRPLVRKRVSCACIGADEAMLRTLVAEASRGDIPEAAMIASLIVPACQAEPVALLAAQVGQAVRQMAQHARHLAPDTRPDDLHTLH